jgi:hypothetical protein
MAMARNAVQFQKGLNEPEFERYYGTREFNTARPSRRDDRGIARRHEPHHRIRFGSLKS